ncbi:hypothetical protein H5410_040951 [Solanum commersonii]|uniref:AIPP2-like SPOC-like domain-containing protein n=1 Tax=Solanum commersonii TaxID=4109 RepID=A0A9J5XRM1_SOLCO|nr:hypothetical protein H5410_040951 [Solanum commersonii]
MTPKICLNCGYKGFSNAFIHCISCLEVVEPCYCLDKVTFPEYVPWVCNECKENEITRMMNFDAIPPVTCLVEHSHVAQPVDDHIWKVVAHPSDKESQSVSEKAKLLQLYLHFEMVSKDDLWPKYFNTPEAIVDGIELYFFPSEARIQTPDNVLAARDVVNDRAPTEDDAQVMTDELGRGKRI